jgi:perosamine synthetase
MTPGHIPVAAPVLNGNERAYVLDCLDSGWISSVGRYISAFESAFAKACGTRHAIACCNGTAAIHLLLHGLGVGPGDEVIIPTLTFVATANAVLYCGAVPVFVDADWDTWNIDVRQVEKAITPRTRAILVVHLYGLPVDMEPLREVAGRHGIQLLEDAAEAFGAAFRGCPAGSLGRAATFSLFGNKTLSTGEGGMITTDDDALAAHLRQLRGQGMDPGRRYWFPILGFNYRMTNVAAAIGLAQIERAEWHLRRRAEVFAGYHAALARVPGLRFQQPDHDSVHGRWMFGVVLPDNSPLTRDQVMEILAGEGIETRPFFHPMHTLPHLLGLAVGRVFPVADHLAIHGLCLPTWAGLEPRDIERIAVALIRCLRA